VEKIFFDEKLPNFFFLLDDELLYENDRKNLLEVS
jgi:hypothetical protein